MHHLKRLLATLAVLFCAIAQGAQPVIEVYKSPHCGCCTRWEAILEEHGFEVISHKTGDMPAVKAELGVPGRLASCHTGVIDGYFIEGHVPAADILRLLAEKPEIRGLSVPGMPAGENVPGMETRPGNAKFDVWAVGESDASIYSRHE